MIVREPIAQAMWTESNHWTPIHTGLDPRSVIVLDPGESWQFYR